MSPREVPPLQVEQLALGELPPAREAELRARLADADARVAALRADDREVLAAHPPARVAAEVARRARPRPRRALWLAAPALAAAAAVLVLRTGPEDPVPEDMSGETRIKGEPRLLLHRQAGDAALPLPAGSEVRAGDVLQISYVAAGAAHGVVLSLDGDGVVTLHAPVAGGTTALRQGGAVPLPQAYELDDAAGFERFVLVSAASPIEPEVALAAARRLAGAADADRAPLPLPPAWRQSSILVKKVPR